MTSLVGLAELDDLLRSPPKPVQRKQELVPVLALFRAEPETLLPCMGDAETRPPGVFPGQVHWTGRPLPSQVRQQHPFSPARLPAEGTPCRPARGTSVCHSPASTCRMELDALNARCVLRAPAGAHTQLETLHEVSKCSL
eukprot:s2133_g14.t1